MDFTVHLLLDNLQKLVCLFVFCMRERYFGLVFVSGEPEARKGWRTSNV